ncbi:methyltransferase [Streptomyces sp. B6B3]|uniref:methyltransferase n=1 Tax=Streptomyces sp. B6B3 TaxID=3153570 RepID=UPI00325D8F8A
MTTQCATSDIVSLTNSLCDAQALLTALELDLFTTLHSEPADAEAIGRSLDLPGPGVADWLNLLVLNGLLEREGHRYHNAPPAEEHLVRGAPRFTGDLLLRRVFPALLGLTQSLRTGRSNGGVFMEALNGLDVVRQFANQMDYTTASLVPHLLDAYDGWAGHRSLLDVGGCRGSVMARILAAYPNLKGHVFDLPVMSPLFDEVAAEWALADRATFHAGDFFADPLPSADIVMMGHTLVDWSPEQRRLLIRKLAGSVNPGGSLLIYDRALGHASPHVEHQNLKVSLSMLVLTGNSNYSLDELRDHASAVGFTSIDPQPLGQYDTLVVCRT